MTRPLTQRPARSQRAAILRALRTYPATSNDVATHTGLPMRYCSAVMYRLWRDGKLDRSGSRVRPPNGMGSGAYVYARRAKRPWTRLAERQLAEMAGTLPVAAIAARMGRTESAILNRAFRLGLAA